MLDVPTWPRTFLDEVEQADVGPAPLLWALGGPSFVLRTAEATVWIDPYFGGTPDDAVPRAYRAPAIPVDPAEVRHADVVISTHDHVDHCHEGTLMPIVGNTAAVCVAPATSARLMRGWGVPDERLHELAPGDRFELADVTLTAHPSYDPGEPGAISFVLEAGGTTLFISGDTALGPGLEAIGEAGGVDYALLAFGRTWYMNERDMLAAAHALRPRVLLPFHWEFWRNHTGNVVELLRLYHDQQPPFAIELLLVGDSLELVPRPAA